MAIFKYKEKDSEGKDTLEIIASADNFNKWMYDVIQPNCQGDILEIGSGIGNISQYFINNNKKIFLSDIRQSYCEILRTRFESKSNLLGIEPIDLVDADFDIKYAAYLNRFDTVFSLNVIEHIEQDALAIRNSLKMLKAGGHLLILTPAYSLLYNKFDTELQHYRRYTRPILKNMIERQGVEVTNAWYFNVFGIIGWLLFGSILQFPMIPEDKMKFYNKLVPLTKYLDIFVFRNIGLSVIVVGTKK